MEEKREDAPPAPSGKRKHPRESSGLPAFFPCSVYQQHCPASENRLRRRLFESHEQAHRSIVGGDFSPAHGSQDGKLRNITPLLSYAATPTTTTVRSAQGSSEEQLGKNTQDIDEAAPLMITPILIKCRGW